MSKYCTKSIRSLFRCQRGTSATEFALLLPVLIILFFGLLEVSDAMTVNRKVAISTNTLADLTAQSTVLSHTEMDGLLVSIDSILEPADTTGLDIKVVSVVLDSGTSKPTVHWSRDNDGNEPYAIGDEYTGLTDTTVLDANASLIVVELNYSFTSSLSTKVLGAPINFSQTSIRWPRLSSEVQLCTDDAKTSCTS